MVEKLFFWLMEVAVVNSYIHYSLDKKESGKNCRHTFLTGEIASLSLWAM